MNKTDLTKAVATKFTLSQTKSSEIISYIFEEMTQALTKKEAVQLIGFGSFAVKSRKARAGRNPKTGAEIKIAARNAIHFTAGKVLKEKINKK